MRICIVCSKALTGKQKIYCSVSCRNRKYYEEEIKGSPEEQYKAHIRLTTIQAGARKRNLGEVTLTKDRLVELLRDPCVYCGNDYAPTVDRKDSKLSYTNENCVAACSRCNRIKSNDVSYEEMMKISEMLAWRAKNDTSRS